MLKSVLTLTSLLSLFFCSLRAQPFLRNVYILNFDHISRYNEVDKLTNASFDLPSPVQLNGMAIKNDTIYILATSATDGKMLYRYNAKTYNRIDAIQLNEQAIGIKIADSHCILKTLSTSGDVTLKFYTKNLVHDATLDLSFPSSSSYNFNFITTGNILFVFDTEYSPLGKANFYVFDHLSHKLSVDSLGPEAENLFTDGKKIYAVHPGSDFTKTQIDIFNALNGAAETTCIINKQYANFYNSHAALGNGSIYLASYSSIPDKMIMQVDLTAKTIIDTNVTKKEYDSFSTIAFDTLSDVLYVGEEHLVSGGSGSTLGKISRYSASGIFLDSIQLNNMQNNSPSAFFFDYGGAINTSYGKQIKDEHLDWSVFPNPMHQVAFIKNGNITTSNGYFNLFDMLGNKVSQQSFKRTGDLVIDRQGLSNGIYFFQIEVEDKIIKMGKLVIE